MTILTVPAARFGAMLETFAQMNTSTPCVVDATPSPAILRESMAPMILSAASCVPAPSKNEPF